MEELLNVEEMARLLKVDKSWLYARTRLKGEGQIPCIRVGKYIRFRETDVLAWLGDRQEGDGK